MKFVKHARAKKDEKNSRSHVGANRERSLYLRRASRRNMLRRNERTAMVRAAIVRSLMLATVLSVMPLAHAQALPFFDDFNRNNSNTVGNGWLELEARAWEARVRNNRLHFRTNDWNNTPIVAQLHPELVPLLVARPIPVEDVAPANGAAADLIERVRDDRCVVPVVRSEV